MRLVAATLVALCSTLLSIGLLVAADEATDLAAVAGGTGLVLGGALLGLTALAWRWRGSSAAYTTTVIDRAGFYEELGAALDETADDYVSATAAARASG